MSDHSRQADSAHEESSLTDRYGSASLPSKGRNIAQGVRGLATKLIRDEGGQDLAEYAVAMALLTYGAILAAHAIEYNLHTLWDAILGLLRSEP